MPPTPEPSAERRVSRAADLEARVLALEEQSEEQHRMLKEVHAAIVGTPQVAGQAEQLRDHEKRITTQERRWNLLAGVVTAAATAVASAWATLAGGPRPPTPHP